MTEPLSLELLGKLIEQVLDGQRRTDGRLERIETMLAEIDADLRSLARVMLRLESRIYAVEERTP